MPKWKQDETEFVVALNPTAGTHDCKIPKPVVERLGMPSALKFTITKSRILVTAGEKK